MILDDKRPRAPFGTTGQQSQDRAERGGSSEKKGAPDPLRTRPGLSLVGLLLDSSNPYACPHGRPIIVDIRNLDIEKHFHRK